MVLRRLKIMNWIQILGIILVSSELCSGQNKEGYYGKYIGKLSQLHHGVSGDVFAVDARTLHLRNFNYDGEGPAAYFYAGNSKAPGAGGFRLRDERGSTNVLPKYRNKHITITLPEGQNLQSIRWFSVWCDEFSVNFGDVKIPKNLDFPKPQKINGLSGVHGVSSEPIVIVDAQTLLIPSFSYDGEAPDAKFWVGQGFKPSPQGIKIPDENGKILPLRRYDRKTIVLTLPGDLTIFDIGHFGVWCEAFTVDFGHVQIPRGLNVPPSLKMLGVSPQSKLNCEVLWDDFAYEVRWAVAGDSIVLQLVARLENNEYMSFGLSGENGRSKMVGGDVVVAWVDKDSLKGYAQDYYLDAKSQCSGGRGSCPDENIIPGTDSVRLLNAALVNGYSIVTFQRSLKAQDELDKPVYTNQSQPIIWAIGPLNSKKEVSYHSLANRRDIFIDFGRSPKWNCPTPESSAEQAEPEEEIERNREAEEKKRIPDARVADTRIQDTGRREARPKTTIPTPAPAPKTNAWDIPAIKCYEPEDGVFYAQMGPTGGKRGYSAITGHVGWGISWYINGLLIPEINVVRGRTYTFIVEGGLDPETPARYHPFYITDDPVGGYQYKTPEERANIQIFAGAVQNKRGEVRPTGVGRLCNWTPDPNQPPADEFSSFGAYQRTLRLECDPGNPGIIQWTVDKDTPDTVYYQCYTHRYLGWKINVHDHCEGEAASDPVPSIVKAPSDILKSYEEDAEGSESVNFETRVKPDLELLKTLSTKNQTLGVNEFASQSNVLKYWPEFHNEAGEEISSTTNSKGGLLVSQNPVVIPQVMDDLNSHIPPTILYSLQPQFPQVQVLLPEINSMHIPTDTKIQSYTSHIPSYSVTEDHVENEKKQTFQNFQIIPLTASKPAEEFFGQVRTEILRQKNSPLQTLPTIQQIKTTNDLLQIPSNLKIQSDEKQKPLIQKKPVNRPVNRVKKPMHPLAIHQRPSLQFRAPHPGKPLPRPQVPNIPKVVQIPINKGSLNSHRANFPNRPLDLNKQESQKLQQVRYQFHNYKKHQEPGFVKKPQQSELLSSSSAHRQTLQNEPYAKNTGFNPDSVQVEGGFKPILNTGIAPIRNVNLIDRADTDISRNGDGKIGTVDLIDKDKDLDFQKIRGVEKREDGKEEKEDGEQVDLFKNLEPETFEPIFIPSFPDDSSKEHRDKFYKKPILSLKTNSGKFLYENSQKNTQLYVKMRPTASLVSRPLYPDHRVPLQGGVSRWRSRESQPLTEEENRHVSKHKVNNFSLANTKTASNIQDVLRKFESESEVETSFSTKRAATATTKSDADEKIAMADEKKNFYLPPQGPRFLSYDGKLVKAEVPPVLPDEIPGPDVSKLPQFVPYRGVIPPLSQTVNAKNLPQLRSSKLARIDILPPSGESGSKSTESHKSESDESFSKESLHSQGERSQPGRKKRSPDHVPGHIGPDQHAHHDPHDHHDHHDSHDHSHHNSSSTNSSKLLLLAFSTFLYFFKYFSL